MILRFWKTGAAWVCVAAATTLFAHAPSAFAQWSNDPAVNTPVSTETGSQSFPVVTTDGAAGAIIVWQDGRSGGWDVYAQRLDATGLALWTPNGEAMTSATDDQRNPVIASDGAGGAVIAWVDDASASGADVYAQRVDASGAVLWGANGIAVCTATGSQFTPAIATDGAGGAIVTWEDSRGASSDIYAQRIGAGGLAEWSTNGDSICTAANFQTAPVIVSDGAGGAIIAWHDFRFGGSNRVFAQRVASDGSRMWPANGVALCSNTGGQEFPAITSDGASGAIVAWEDYRVGIENIFAQRIGSLGTLQWPDSGVAICAASGSQNYVRCVPDGSGGAVMTWQDSRVSAADVYAQRVSASGAVQWSPANGVAIAATTNYQRLPFITAVEDGGATICWYDARSGSTYDVFAQRVSLAGVVQWTANGVVISNASGNQFFPVIVGDGSGGAIIAWEDPRNGPQDIYAQQVDRFGVLGVVPVSVSEGAGPSAGSTLFANAPNPFARSTSISYALAREAHVRLAVYDVSGRRVAVLDEGVRPAGTHRALFDSDGLSSGTYVYRLEIDGATVAARRLALVR
jgi:hypothetical protein